MGEGIIIFALWYLAIAYNYYIENYVKEEKDEETETNPVITSNKSSIAKVSDVVIASEKDNSGHTAIQPLIEIVEEFEDTKAYKIEDIVPPPEPEPDIMSDTESLHEDIQETAAITEEYDDFD